MATIGGTNLTLLDWAKRLDGDGKKVARVVELLSQRNEILEDMVYVQGNLPTGHRVVVRTGLPPVYWRQLNAGVPTSKSTTAQVDEAAAMMEARSHVDVELLRLSNDPNGLRMSEDAAFLEAMNQQMASTLFYGAANDPKTFVGLANRYSSLSAGNGSNIINAAGAGSDNMSIWLINWSEDAVFGIFPQGSKAGVSHEDLGVESVQDANGNWYQAARTLFQWKTGLVVRDWRHAVRIANIDVSNLVAESSAADLIKFMSRALDRPPMLNGKPCFYMNRTAYSMLRIQALNKSANALSIESALTQFGTPQATLKFQGIPIRRCDALLETEAVVS